MNASLKRMKMVGLCLGDRTLLNLVHDSGILLLQFVFQLWIRSVGATKSSLHLCSA